jgi:hypothetical protein
VAVLRQIGVPLAEIKVIVALKPKDAAERIAGYWSGVEQDHETRRDIAGYLIERLNGKRSSMYEVATRQIPNRSLLCLTRHVDEQGIWLSARSSSQSSGPALRQDGRRRRGCLLHLPRHCERGQRWSRRVVPACPRS